MKIFFAKKRTFGSYGFTLVELLVTIGVIGVLAGITTVAINPLEQFARSRDAKRKTTIIQLGDAVNAHFIDRNGTLPAASGWLTTLKNERFLKEVPPPVNYSLPSTLSCTPGQNNWCYAKNGTGTEFNIWARLESNNERRKCSGGSIAFYIYSSTDQRPGTICNSGEPTLFQNYTFLPNS